MHDPVDDNDATTKKYVHDHAPVIAKDGHYDAKNKRVKRLAAPTESTDGSSKAYVDTTLTSVLTLVPSATAKCYDGKSRRLTNLADPVDAQEACTK